VHLHLFITHPCIKRRQQASQWCVITFPPCSGDISRLLPAEAALLARGRTVRASKLLFYARLAEKGLQTYERDGWGEFPTRINPDRREVSVLVLCYCSQLLGSADCGQQGMNAVRPKDEAHRSGGEALEHAELKVTPGRYSITTLRHMPFLSRQMPPMQATCKAHVGLHDTLAQGLVVMADEPMPLT
jgi:hypothetical protein